MCTILPIPRFSKTESLSFVFLWAARLSFVYESKEKMRHEQRHEKKKAPRNPGVKHIKINILISFFPLFRPPSFSQLQFFVDSQTP
ncbi:hypothetical protein EFB14_23780 [Rhizobium fabae]|uniref:Uncharacterized protein n=1 Tax=Rhizobium fabae TaxID=573179 RepID=A0ABY0B437_9HYPH|nr:hypothetical protein EFB14_23780 [Rhizobium fabae]